MQPKPRVNEDGQKELAKIEKSFDSLGESIRDINPLECKAPEPEFDPLTKLSKKQMEMATAPYIKPLRSQARPVNEKQGMKVHFNEKHRPLYEKDWEWLKVTVDNYEMIGSDVEMWTAEWGCDPAYFWVIPTNKPVYLPRFVARRLKKCRYHEMHMEGDPQQGAKPSGGDQFSKSYGVMEVRKTKQRLDANLYGDSI